MIRVSVWIILWLGCSLWAWNTSSVLAQDSLSVLRSSLVRQNNFSTGTQQEFRLFQNFGPVSLTIRHNQEGLYNQSLETRKFVQANAENQIWIRYRKNARWQPLVFLESDAFFNSENARSQWYGGIAWRGIPGMEVVPLLGYSLDIRNGRLDRGLTYATLYSYRPLLNRGKTHMSLNALSRVKWIAPRRQDNHRLDWEISTELPGGIRPWVQTQGAWHELDDYQGKSVQRMMSDTLMATAGVYFSLGPWFSGEISQRAGRQHRRFAYRPLLDTLPEFNHSKFRQNEVQSLVRLSFRSRKWLASASYEYLLLDRSYFLENQLNLAPGIFQELARNESEKNYRSAFQKWNVFSRLNLSARHGVEAEYSSQYLKYDTPLSTNQDDRDEITYILRTGWDARWRKNFSMVYEYTLQSRYSGYLAGIRSRDNYHQYNLKFRIGSEWEFVPGWVLKSNQAVYVTYNVKSFGDPQLTDRSTRFWENQAELSAAWHQRWRSSFGAERKVQRLSYLNWLSFAESPLDTTWFTTLQTTHEYTLGKSGSQLTWTLGVGYRYFLLQRNLNVRTNGSGDPILNVHMMNRQSGPVSEFRLRTRKNNQIGCRIWWQQQRVWNRQYPGLQESYAGQTMTETELQAVQEIFRPYFEISLSLGF